MIRAHRLECARWLASPNQDARPEGVEISLLVIHNITLPPGEFGGDGVDRLFTNCLDPRAHPFFGEISHLRVSSHLLIRRDGRITQYVPFDRRAWHAGESCFRGRTVCNDFSIGIELEGTDHEPYTDAQYRELERVSAELMSCYPGITPDRIVGHCNIAPGRKTDPGEAFDWSRYLASLTGGVAAT